MDLGRRDSVQGQTQPGRACSPAPSSFGHHLYLVGGIAVPDDELPILGGADQQPVGRWQGRCIRVRMWSSLWRKGHPHQCPVWWEALLRQFPAAAQKFLLVQTSFWFPGDIWESQSSQTYLGTWVISPDLPTTPTLLAINLAPGKTQKLSTQSQPCTHLESVPQCMA